jgi:hypothetical protein
MYLRIGGLELTAANGYGIADPNFGRAGAPDRTFACTVRVYGIGGTAALADADMRAKLTALAVELCRNEVLIVARPADAAAAAAIRLRGRGKQPWEEPYTVVSESRHRTEVLISLVVDPHTDLAEPHDNDTVLRQGIPSGCQQRPALFRQFR